MKNGQNYYTVKNSIFYDGVMKKNKESKIFIDKKLKKIEDIEIKEFKTIDDAILSFKCNKEDYKKLYFEIKYLENLNVFELNRIGRGKEYVELKSRKEDLIQSIDEQIKYINENRVIAYTDGSNKTNERAYKYGIFIKFPNGYLNCISGKCEGNKSIKGSLAGELQAVIECISYVYSKGYNKLVIYYDCETIHKWLPRNKEIEHINKDKLEIRKNYQTNLKQYMELGMDIEFKKVKAHAQNEDNNFVDKIANIL